MPAPDPNVEYATEQVDVDPNAFVWQRTDQGWSWSGPCPRCGHDVDKQFREEGMFGFRGERAGSEAAGTRTEAEHDAMRCNCVHVHEGGEAGKGCGAWWGLEIEPGG